MTATDKASILFDDFSVITGLLGANAAHHLVPAIECDCTSSPSVIHHDKLNTGKVVPVTDQAGR